MKIKNDLISIKIGKKQYDFHNLILNEYLRTFATSQLDITKVWETRNIKELSILLIKFDTPIENISEEKNLKNEDFDIAILSSDTATKNFSNTEIIVQYNYKITADKASIWDYKEQTTELNIAKYYGKKITALGFNRYFFESYVKECPVCAILDTSNYNIYLQEKQDFTVSRKDIITTDAFFYSNNNQITHPLHLDPLSFERFGIIYSIGLSSYLERIDKEFIIGQDVEITQNGAELEIQGIENYLSAEKPIYPNSNLYPSSSLYPIKANYKYIIIKYKVWTGRNGENMIDTGFFYHQAISIDKFGNLNLKIKYERG